MKTPSQSDEPVVIHLSSLIPSKKNSRQTNRKTGRSFPSAQYTRWNALARMQVMLQHPAHMSGSLCVIALIRYKDLKRADNSNKLESIMDLLVDCHVLEDDCWKIAETVVAVGRLDRGNPGADVLICRRELIDSLPLPVIVNNYLR